MSKMKPEYAQNTWADVAHAVGEWEVHYGLEVVVQLAWKEKLSTGAWVEVILREGGAVGRGEELTRVREPFPARKATGQPGAVLWAVSAAIRALEREPWLWSRKMRREAQSKV